MSIADTFSLIGFGFVGIWLHRAMVTVPLPFKQSDEAAYTLIPLTFTVVQTLTLHSHGTAHACMHVACGTLNNQEAFISASNALSKA